MFRNAKRFIHVTIVRQLKKNILQNFNIMMFQYLETFCIFVLLIETNYNEIFLDKIYGRSGWIYRSTWLENRKKIFYNIDLAEQTNDPKLFKKLQYDIWEFRTKFAGLRIRLLAFWDKSDNKETLVIATHRLVKKANKIPKNEIERAVKLREKYFESKQKK